MFLHQQQSNLTSHLPTALAWQHFGIVSSTKKGFEQEPWLLQLHVRNGLQQSPNQGCHFCRFHVDHTAKPFKPGTSPDIHSQPTLHTQPAHVAPLPTADILQKEKHIYLHQNGKQLAVSCTKLSDYQWLYLQIFRVQRFNHNFRRSKCHFDPFCMAKSCEQILNPSWFTSKFFSFICCITFSAAWCHGKYHVRQKHELQKRCDWTWNIIMIVMIYSLVDMNSSWECDK